MAFKVFEEFEVQYEQAIISAHRTLTFLKNTPAVLHLGDSGDYCCSGLSKRPSRGTGVYGQCPCSGIPVAGTLNGMDALLSISQMPPGFLLGVLASIQPERSPSGVEDTGFGTSEPRSGFQNTLNLWLMMLLRSPCSEGRRIPHMEFLASEIMEECGVFAVVGHPGLHETCYYGLYALQHRGQESAGMAVSNQGRIYTKKGAGLVSDVFTRDDIIGMNGSIALGHVRYSNAGQGGVEDAQPITVKMWQGQMSFAHNGNLVNAQELRKNLEQNGSIFQTTSDCEVIPHLMAKAGEEDYLGALQTALPEVRGAYSLCILTPSGVIAAKDPNGFRPLCLGELDGAYIVCSETCALDAIGATFIRELDPGEAISIEQHNSTEADSIPTAGSSCSLSICSKA